jgi:hypothetical protein
MNKLHNFSDKKGKNLHSSHKITAECFTNCATWKMNATITINKTSIGLVNFYFNIIKLSFRFFMVEHFYLKILRIQF